MLRLPHPRAIPHRVSFPLAILPLALSLALVACGTSSTVKPTPTATPSPTPTPIPKASVVRVTNSQHFPDSKLGGTTAPCGTGDPLINGDCGVTVPAICANGDVVLSGGYMLDDALAFISSSYPANARTWAVTVHDEGQDGGSHPVTVTAYADCLHANFDAGVSIVSKTPVVPADGSMHESTLSCPGGSLVTGGGFRGTNGTDETIPAANGWNAGLRVQSGGTAQPELFAICAKTHLTRAGQPEATATPALGTGASLTVSCPAGTLLAGGGGMTVGYGNITTLAANDTLTEWQVKISASGAVGGPQATYSVVGKAICLDVH